MSIEAMKQVIELYDKHCHNNDYGGIEFNNKHGYKFIEAIEALRTAISQQPATGEPVGYMNEGHIHELAMRRIPYGYVYPEAGAGASTAVYTHPSPRHRPRSR